MFNEKAFFFPNLISVIFTVNNTCIYAACDVHLSNYWFIDYGVQSEHLYMRDSFTLHFYSDFPEFYWWLSYLIAIFQMNDVRVKPRDYYNVEMLPLKYSILNLNHNIVNYNLEFINSNHNNQSNCKSGKENNQKSQHLFDDLYNISTCLSVS